MLWFEEMLYIYIYSLNLEKGGSGVVWRSAEFWYLLVASLWRAGEAF